MRALFFISLLLITAFNSSAQEKSSCHEADSLLSNYQFLKAETALLACLSKAEGDLGLLRHLAYTSYQLGKYKEAKNFNYQIITLDSTNRKARMELAKLYEKENQLKQALDQYEYLIQLDSSNSYFQRKYASLSFNTGNIPESIKHYRITLSLNPKDIIATIEYARVCQEIKNFQWATNVLYIALMADTSNVQLRFELAKLYYREHKYEDVVYQFQKMFEHQEDTNLLQKKMLGVALFQTEAYEESLELMLEVTENSQDNEVVYYYIAQAYKKLGDLENSRLNFEKAIKEGISKNITNYYTQLAMVYEEEGRYSESIQAFQKAYSYSQEQILLYHLARNYDLYYKDKAIAMRYYEKFLEETDSNNIPLQDYSAARLEELKQIMHFDLDSLNKN